MAFMRWFRLGSLLGLLVASLSYAGEPTGSLARFGQSRSWSDQSGRFEVVGSMKFADEQQVEIEKEEDGLVVTVPLDRLSRQDQAFVLEFLFLAEAEQTADNPFAGGMLRGTRDAAPAASPQVPAAPAGGALRKLNALTRQARRLAIAPDRAFWSAPSPIPFPEVAVEDAIITADLAKPFFASMRVAAAGRSGTVVLNAYHQGRGGRDENYSRFATLDANSQQASPVYDFDEPWKLMAIAPNASMIAAVRVEGFDKGNDVAIFRIAGGQLIPQFQFTAGGGSWDELHWVAFLPGNRLATISQKHDLTFWDLKEEGGIRALLRGNTGGSLTAATTPAGELMAFPHGTAIAVLETKAGKLVGCIMRDAKAEQLAFASSGKYLAAFHPFTVTLYSLEDGSEARVFAVPESAPETPLLWCGGHLMVGDVLYDVERGVPMWSYEGRAAARTSFSSSLLSAFGEDSHSTLTICRVPHQEAIRAAAKIDPRTIYAITRGDRIAVDYNMAAVPPPVQQQIRQAIETKIRQLGWEIAPQASHRMLVALTQGSPEEVDYYTRTGVPIFAPPGFGPPPSGPAEKVQFRPWTHTLTITSQGQTVFLNEYVRSAPQTLQLREGESTHAAVARFVQPVPEHFTNLPVPPSVLKPEYQGGLGRSTITAAGIR